MWISLVALLLTSVVMTGTVTVASPTTARIYVEPPLIKNATEYPVNSTFSVDINVADVADLYGWEFTLVFNPNILQVATVPGENMTEWTDTWTGDGTETTFSTVWGPIEDSELVFVGGVLQNKTAGDYTIDYEAGSITFATPPGSGLSIEASYYYVESQSQLDMWTGDGTATTFFTTYKPIVSYPPEFVFVGGVPQNKTAGDYTIDYEAGNITFATPPGSGIPILAVYRNVVFIPVYAVTEGPFLQKPGYKRIFSSETDNDVGTVKALGTYWPPYPPTGASGNGTLATIEFIVAFTGVCALELQDTLLNTVTEGVLDPIPHTAEDGYFDNRGAPERPNALFEVILPPGAIMPVPGLPITFNASDSNDDDDLGWIVSYDWKFESATGDFTNATGMIVDHVFDLEEGVESATYLVNLTVTDNDNLTDWKTEHVQVVGWMAGGTFPDLLKAEPESERWQEGKGKREIILFGLVGNPSNDTAFNVYVEFTIFDMAEVALLGIIKTEIATIGANSTLELNATMDLREPTWRVGADKVSWGDGVNLVWANYGVFARCYRNVNGGFEKGLVAKEFGFKVHTADHDVAVLDVTTNLAVVEKGDPLEIYVTMENQGGASLTETFNITLTYKGRTTTTTEFDERSSELAGLEIKTETFILDTGTLPEAGLFLIRAKLSTLTYELEVADNFDSCVITVRWDHDVRVSSVTPLNATVAPGETALIEVEVANEGTHAETFDVTVYYDDQVIGTQTVTGLLPSGARETLTFAWDTTGVAKGEYTIKANASLATEMFPDDNVLVDGTIKVSVRPVASFTISPDPPYYANVTLTFNATASYDPDGTIVSYDWDFGDGNTDSGEIVEYAFASVGNYTVTLTVTDDTGVTAIDTCDVTVLGHDIEVTSVTAYVEGPGGKPVPLIFPESVEPGETVFINVTVTNVGTFSETFDVTVYYDNTTLGTQTVTDLAALEDTSLIFTWVTTAKGPDYVVEANASAVPDEFDLTNNVGSCVVSVRFLQDVLVRSVTPLDEVVGAGETALIEVEVANEGTHDATFSVTVYYDDQVVGIQMVTKLAPDGEQTLTFGWNTTGVAKGNYTIRAEASDPPDKFPDDNVLIDGTIEVRWICPVASFTISPDPPYNATVTLTFNASASYDPDGTIVSYDWDFGDENVTTVADPTITHAYDGPGDYTVALTVTDDDGMIDIVTLYISIEEAP